MDGETDRTLEFAVEPIGSAAALERLWRGLDASGEGSFFVSWLWIGTWLSVLPRGIAPLMLTARRKSEIVAAAILAPRRIRRHGVLAVNQLHFNSTGDRHLDGITIEHNGFAGGKDCTPLLWRALARFFARGGTGADELVLPGIDVEAAQALGQERLLVSSQEVPAFRVPLRGLSRSGFEACLSRNARQQLRRSIRNYEAKGGLRLDQAKSVDEALAYFEGLKGLHIRSWTRRGKPHAFRHPFFEIFHRALIARGMPENAVQMLRISAGERPIGYLLNFRHRGRVYAYQSGFDDADPALRPGYVSHALAIAEAAASGAQVYDFLAGANRLKQSFARETYRMSWSALRRPTLTLRAEDLARRLVRRMSAWSRQS